MGLLIVFGHRRGGVLGKLNRQIGPGRLQCLLGFAMPGINNWGHIGGFWADLGWASSCPLEKAEKDGALKDSRHSCCFLAFTIAVHRLPSTDIYVKFQL